MWVTDFEANTHQQPLEKYKPKSQEVLPDSDRMALFETTSYQELVGCGKNEPWHPTGGRVDWHTVDAQRFFNH